MPDGRDTADAALIARAQRGHEEAFGELYERYSIMIYRYVYLRLGSPLDAEDLTEDIFFRAWQNLPKYDERGIPFAAYLFQIARNALIDHYRKHKATVTSIEDLEIRGMDPDPEDSVSSKLDFQEMRQQMSHLPEDYQNVLVFRFLSGLSPEETARIMNRSEGAIRVLQFRALTALKRLLKTSTDGADG
jgi:RNA polymerase sigma-70 factor, ECF subfamily